ncbi:MAG TPA: M28 family peptidase [Blastocatellia bacterium]|nr:M28 family peptidase [Blastocatellia bacterium]
MNAKTIQNTVTVLSAKDMEGRGTATPGGDRAAQWIADQFAALGLKPAGENGTYLQPVAFKSSQINSESSVTAGTVALKFGEEFVPAPPFTMDKTSASGDLVFVGYGVASTDLARDDFAGLDVKGKIVVVLSGRPKNSDEAKWTKSVNQQTLIGGLVQRGVAGIVVAGYDTPERSFSKISGYLTRRSVSLASVAQMPFQLPPIVLTSSAGAEKLFAASGATFADAKTKAETGEFASRALGTTGNMTIIVDRKEGKGSNVAAVLEGSDPTLKAQAILYTAHYDAFGLTNSGGYYPGAADNALGVGEIIAIAEAMSKDKNRPRRSIVFLAVTGEEYGLLGAKYWADHPTWPLENVAANINYDGIGTEIYGPVKQVVGFGAEYSDIGTVFEQAVVATGMRSVPDPMPEEKAFYRSDHYAFVKKGVPALMLLGGPDGPTEVWIKRANEWLEKDYHQTTDVIGADWDWGGARTVATIGLVVGMRLAAADAMPQWLASSPFQRPAKAAAAAGN